MATEVLRPHNILLPAPHHRIRPASPSSHRRPSSSNNPAGAAATRRSPPAGRRHHGRKQAASRPAAEVYAGPAFSTCPEPSALPLPQFLPVKKAAGVAAVVDDAATRDLRRILRLE